MEVRVDEKAGFSYSTHVSTKRAHCQMGRPGDQLVGGRGLPTVLLICRCTQPSGPAENILNFVIISFFRYAYRFLNTICKGVVHVGHHSLISAIIESGT